MFNKRLERPSASGFKSNENNSATKQVKYDNYLDKHREWVNEKLILPKDFLKGLYRGKLHQNFEGLTVSICCVRKSKLRNLLSVFSICLLFLNSWIFLFYLCFYIPYALNERCFYSIYHLKSVLLNLPFRPYKRNKLIKFFRRDDFSVNCQLNFNQLGLIS